MTNENTISLIRALDALEEAENLIECVLLASESISQSEGGAIYAIKDGEGA